MNNYRDWDRKTPIFQWAIRTTTKLYNGAYTPYEVITGMKPRSPIDAILGGPAYVLKQSTEQYVEDLIKYIKDVHRHVDAEHEKVRHDQNNAKLREFGVGQSLSVGNYCLVVKPKKAGVSYRFQPKHHDQVFQVVHVNGEPDGVCTYVLSDLLGRRSGLGFSQPVAAERLTPVELLPLARPLEEARTELVLEEQGRERKATIEGQTADVKVHVKYENIEDITTIDLATANYRWVV
jgi:hypothetical protein